MQVVPILDNCDRKGQKPHHKFRSVHNCNFRKEIFQGDLDIKKRGTHAVSENVDNESAGVKN